MTQSKHTPGPWRTAARQFRGLILEDVYVTCDNSNFHVDLAGVLPTSGPHGRLEELQANARLIAAAPDYDAAADLAIVQMEQCLKLVGDDEGFLQALNALKAARAKAKGEA